MTQATTTSVYRRAEPRSAASAWSELAKPRLTALVVVTTRYVSVGGIAAGIALPILTHLGARYHHVDNDKSNPTLWEAGTWNKPLFAFALLAGILAVWRHRSNIKRISLGKKKS